MKKTKRMRLRGRPTLMDASASLLFAAAGMAVLRALRGFPGGALDTQAMDFVWDGAQAALLIVLGRMLARRIRAEKREERTRLAMPTIVQLVLVVLSICAGTLFLDDLTLFVGAFLQRMGLNVARAIAPPAPVDMNLYTISAICTGVLPAIAFEYYFHGAFLSAWERRGTMYGMWVATLVGAGLCSGIVEFPAQLLLTLAAGLIAVRSGSLFLAIFLRVGIDVAGVAARNVQAQIGVNAARYARIWAEIGGKKGWAVLGLETVLLGAVFACTVAAVCSAKPVQKILYRSLHKDANPMDSAEVFVLCAAVVIALALLFADFAHMANMI